MFMRGQMERNLPPGVMVAHVHKVEWKVDAIVQDDSKKFAEELQTLLNDSTDEGYTVSHMMPRATDNGLVVVQQRCLVEEPTYEGQPVSQGGN